VRSPNCRSACTWIKLGHSAMERWWSWFKALAGDNLTRGGPARGGQIPFFPVRRTSADYLRRPGRGSRRLGGREGNGIGCRLLECGRSANFSSDRSYREYATRIWRPMPSAVTIKLLPSDGDGDSMETATALRSLIRLLDWCSSCNLGSSSIKVRPDRAGGRHSWQQSSSFESGQGGDGPLLGPWMPGCLRPCRPGWSGSVWAAPPGGAGGDWSHDPDVDHTGGGRGAPAPSSPWRATHKPAPWLAIAWAAASWRSGTMPQWACFDTGFTGTLGRLLPMPVRKSWRSGGPCAAFCSMASNHQQHSEGGDGQARPIHHFRPD